MKDEKAKDEKAKDENVKDENVKDQDHLTVCKVQGPERRRCLVERDGKEEGTGFDYCINQIDGLSEYNIFLLFGLISFLMARVSEQFNLVHNTDFQQLSRYFLEFFHGFLKPPLTIFSLNHLNYSFTDNPSCGTEV